MITEPEGERGNKEVAYKKRGKKSNLLKEN